MSPYLVIGSHQPEDCISSLLTSLGTICLNTIAPADPALPASTSSLIKCSSGWAI